MNQIPVVFQTCIGCAYLVFRLEISIEFIILFQATKYSLIFIGQVGIDFPQLAMKLILHKQGKLVMYTWFSFEIEERF